eukprot:TRINITY_DN61_c0_g2_i2.p1 TRINITY_DN61_c0_g2~~TRINITY_DN61_c0_g2_i2.p1  ORF type:complete len:322 (+),score=155.59 TRINITY_DN61_c0_g2_i2:256-1221(+)
MDKFNIEEDWVDIAPTSNLNPISVPQAKREEGEDFALEDSIRKSLGGMGKVQKTEQILNGNPFATSVINVKEQSDPVTRFLPQTSLPVVVPEAEPVSPTESDDEDSSHSVQNLSSSVIGTDSKNLVKEEINDEVKNHFEEKIEEKEIKKEEKEIERDEEKEEKHVEEEEKAHSVDRNSSFGKSLTASVLSPEAVHMAETAWNLSRSTLPHISDDEEPKEEKETIREEKVEALVAIPKEEVLKIEPKLEENKDKKEEKKVEKVVESVKIAEKAREVDPIFGDLKSNGVTALPCRDMELFIITGSLLTMVIHSFLFAPQCAAF